MYRYIDHRLKLSTYLNIKLLIILYILYNLENINYIWYIAHNFSSAIFNEEIKIKINFNEDNLKLSLNSQNITCN